MTEAGGCPVVHFDHNSDEHSADPVGSYRALREKAFAISEEMIGAIGFDTGEFDDLKTKLRLLTERVSAPGVG